MTSWNNFQNTAYTVLVLLFVTSSAIGFCFFLLDGCSVISLNHLFSVFVSATSDIFSALFYLCSLASDFPSLILIAFSPEMSISVPTPSFLLTLFFSHPRKADVIGSVCRD